MKGTVRQASRCAVQVFSAALISATAAATMGCQGFGAPVVGVRPAEGGEGGGGCELGPMCRPVRVVEPGAFHVPDRLAASDDCDRDGVPDAVDECPGVPNLPGDAQACAAATEACERLARGEGSFVGADLRGCRVEARLSPTHSFARADLRCAFLTLAPAIDDHGSEGEWGPADRVDLAEVRLEDGALEVRGPVRVSAPDLVLRRAQFLLTEGASLSAPGAFLEGARIDLGPAPASDEPFGDPVLDLSSARISGGVVHLAPSSRPSRVRLDRSEVQGALIVAPAIDAVNAVFEETSLETSQLLALGTRLRDGAVRTEYAAFASASLEGVIFDRCGELSFTESDLLGVDVPVCAPGDLRLVDVEAIDSRFGGGIEALYGAIRVSVIGGAASTLSTFGTDFEVVTFCDQEAGVFVGGELRCVRCGAEDFTRGEAVCLAGSRVIERGCSAIELAPECDPALAVDPRRP